MADAVALQWLGNAGADPGVPPEHYYLPPEKLVSGNPRQTVWMQYTDASGCFFAGVWESEPGKWRIAYTEEEHCRMLGGESVITGADGLAQRVRAGDQFVIPRGFVGTWEVIVTTRKAFVIHETGVPLPETAP